MRAGDSLGDIPDKERKRKDMSMLSVIVPVYNEEKSVSQTAKVISGILGQAKIDYELLFINDGSIDGSWQAIAHECEKNLRIKGICFSRNFGKEAAIFAGLECVVGKCAVIIDCDLQHPPEKIVEMYRLWEQGYEVVEGVKSSRGDESIVHRVCANAFYKIIGKLTKKDMLNASDFKLIDRKVIEVLLSMPERNTFFRALSSWAGFRTSQISFEVQERKEGSSKWSAWALIKYAISYIASFSSAPMQIVTVMGCCFFALAVILGIQSLVYKFIGKALAGFTTVIIIELLLGSIMMISMGIIGYYISKMYEEIKGRPRYIIIQKLNDENSNDIRAAE